MRPHREKLSWFIWKFLYTVMETAVGLLCTLLQASKEKLAYAAPFSFLLGHIRPYTTCALPQAFDTQGLQAEIYAVRTWGTNRGPWQVLN